MTNAGHGRVGRRTFLALGALGIAGAAGAAAAVTARLGRRPARTGTTVSASPGTARHSPRPARQVPENSRAGDLDWEIRHLGPADAIEGYAGAASVLTGEQFPLFVSSTSAGFRVTAFRLGWYDGAGARLVWRSGPLRGHRQRAAGRVTLTPGPPNTVQAGWDPAVEVPTDDWPPGSYLLRLDADSGAQRYVPITVRSASAAGRLVIKNCVPTWQAYNTWGGYDLYAGPGQDYAARSLAVSLDRPYDRNGADMFLTYERNVVKLAERMGLPLAYATSMDIAADPRLRARDRGP